MVGYRSNDELHRVRSDFESALASINETYSDELLFDFILRVLGGGWTRPTLRRVFKEDGALSRSGSLFLRGDAIERITNAIDDPTRFEMFVRELRQRLTKRGNDPWAGIWFEVKFSEGDDKTDIHELSVGTAVVNASLPRKTVEMVRTKATWSGPRHEWNGHLIVRLTRRPRNPNAPNESGREAIYMMKRPADVDVPYCVGICLSIRLTGSAGDAIVATRAIWIKREELDYADGRSPSWWKRLREDPALYGPLCAYRPYTGGAVGQRPDDDDPDYNGTLLDAAVAALQKSSVREATPEGSSDRLVRIIERDGLRGDLVSLQVMRKTMAKRRDSDP